MFCFKRTSDQIKQAYTSKQNSELENKVILLKVGDAKKMALYCCEKLTRIAARNKIKKERELFLH